MKTLKPNIIVFAECCYENNDRKLMWQDITATLQILFRLGYEAKVYADCGQSDIICVEYIYQDEEISSGTFKACTWEQIELLDKHTQNEEDFCDEEESGCH